MRPLFASPVWLDAPKTALGRRRLKRWAHRMSRLAARDDTRRQWEWYELVGPWVHERELPRDGRDEWPAGGVE